MTPPGLAIVGKIMALVAPAETAFRSRWRLSTLKRVDAALHDMLAEQIDLYDTALVTGSDADVKVQGEAMVRGWRAACAKLESPLLPDDAYMLGQDSHTGLKVVIAEQKGSVARVQSVNGERVVTVTPDEVARLVAGANQLVEAKHYFPDTEIVD